MFEQPLNEKPIKLTGLYALLFKNNDLPTELHISAFFFDFLFMSFLLFIEHIQSQMRLQALQAFLSVSHYPSTQHLKIYACRRFKSLCFSAAMYISF
jgi:hypothetical protein